MYEKATGCCAMLELADISTELQPSDVLRKATLLREHPSKPFILFSGVIERKREDHASNRTDDYGQKFVDFLTSQGLGEVVTASPERRNPSTGNTVKVWMWLPDRDRLAAWFEANPTEAQMKEDAFVRYITSPFTYDEALINAMHRREIR